MSAEPPPEAVSEPESAAANSIFGELSLARVVIVLYIVGLVAALVIADAPSDPLPDAGRVRTDNQTDRL